MKVSWWGSKVRRRSSTPSRTSKVEPQLDLTAASPEDLAAIHEELANSAYAAAEDLAGRAKRVATRNLRQDRIFHRKIRRKWGTALDLYDMCMQCSYEIGGKAYSREHERSIVEDDFIFESLFGLHGKAIRAGREVSHLLHGGFARGAMARSRTLHEIQVVSATLEIHGRSASTPDIGERFILHSRMKLNWDITNYLRLFPDAPIQVDPEHRKAVQADRDKLLERFGKAYGADYGWAATLVNEPTLAKLEALIDMPHLRYQYLAANHEVHGGDSWGLVLNQFIDDEGRNAISVGPTLTGLADPACVALEAVRQATISAVMGGLTQHSAYDIMACYTFAELTSRAIEAIQDVERPT